MKSLSLLITYNLLLIICVICIPFSVSATEQLALSSKQSTSWWEIQAVDTMKYSRDPAREKNKDDAFLEIIDQQVAQVKSVGGTHVAIATPYDAEFLPFLKKWVAAARKYNLNVWFRGNWSGWEEWFDYPRIDRTAHLAKTVEFIQKNPDLFQDGDIFSPCPECENGGPGDPRNTKDVTGFRSFMIEEYLATKHAFNSIHKSVRTNLASMNMDVARLIMDRDTTASMDGIITIDHYVKDPKKLAGDIDTLVKNTGGRIMLGEFGAPILDIHGDMTPDQQADWVKEALQLLAVRRPQLIGLSYWVGVGGSTEIWNGNGVARPAVSVLRSFYLPSEKINLTIKDDLLTQIPNLKVSWLGRDYRTDLAGSISLPFIYTSATPSPVIIAGDNLDYSVVALDATPSASKIDVFIKPSHPNIWYRLRQFVFQLFKSGR